jgi:hypothetical protein
MGDYLLLEWLSTRRGFAVFVLLVLITASSNLCRYAKQGHVDELRKDKESRFELSQRVMTDRDSVPGKLRGAGARLGYTQETHPTKRGLADLLAVVKPCRNLLGP